MIFFGTENSVPCFNLLVLSIWVCSSAHIIVSKSWSDFCVYKHILIATNSFSGHVVNKLKKIPCPRIFAPFRRNCSFPCWFQCRSGPAGRWPPRSEFLSASGGSFWLVRIDGNPPLKESSFRLDKLNQNWAVRRSERHPDRLRKGIKNLQLKQLCDFKICLAQILAVPLMSPSSDPALLLRLLQIARKLLRHGIFPVHDALEGVRQNLKLLFQLCRFRLAHYAPPFF